jgi:hypothetical protein
MRTLEILGGAGAFSALGLVCVLGCSAAQRPVIVLSRPVADSMNAIFVRSNEHWDELEDLTQLEKMLGTVRPTQKEYLGCLTGSRVGDTVRVQGWIPARNMKQLQFAVTGDCDGTPGLVGTFHTHPFRADTLNRPLKEPVLAKQDLETFAESTDLITVVIWDHDSLDAAAKGKDGQVRHPIPVIVR